MIQIAVRMEEFRTKRDLKGRGIEKMIEIMSKNMEIMLLNNAKLIESITGQGKKETILSKPKNPPV